MVRAVRGVPDAARVGRRRGHRRARVRPWLPVFHARRAGDRDRGLSRRAARERTSPPRACCRNSRLEVGPSYILPTNCSSAREPLFANLLIGRAVCRRFGAEPSPVGYMPDGFGHPLQLPQILAGFGIDSFIFSRGLGDELDELGVVFRWRSPDGSEVRAFQQLPLYSNFNVPGDGALARIEYIAERFGPALQRARVSEVLLCDGEDHRRIRRDLPALCAQLERRLPGTSFAIARLLRLRGRRGLGQPAGVHGRAARQPPPERAPRRQLGAPLSEARERASGAAAARGRDAGRAPDPPDGRRFPVADFRLAWRELLKCHPHDSICGCSCDEVHRDMLVRYEQLDRTVSHLEGRALRRSRCATAPATRPPACQPPPLPPAWPRRARPGTSRP